MLLEILRHTPPWVWLLLAALLGLGLSQRRTRLVHPLRLLILPLVLLALGLVSMAPGFVAHPVIGLLWLAALLLATGLTRRWPVPAGVAWLPAAQRLRVPGSWLPMLIIVTVFGLRYASGVMLALHPAWRTDAAVQLPLALVFGLLSGLLLGRTLALLRCVPRGALAGGAATMPGHGPAEPV